MSPRVDSLSMEDNNNSNHFLPSEAELELKIIRVVGEDLDKRNLTNFMKELYAMKEEILQQVDIKIGVLEAKIDGRFSRLEAKIDSLSIKILTAIGVGVAILAYLS